MSFGFNFSQLSVIFGPCYSAVTAPWCSVDFDLSKDIKYFECFLVGMIRQV